MSWATIADLVLKTSIATFKTNASYIRAADPDNPIAIVGVYDKPNQSVDPQTGVPIDTIHPTFGIRIADLGVGVQPDAGDLITINSIQYKVNESQEDGQGGTKLILNRLTT